MDSGTSASARTPATLQDVAALAGVSAKTVSRALNGELNVTTETRERVTRAAVQLQFRPNRLARELRQGGRTRAVALVIGSLENPFYAHVAAGLDLRLRDVELELIIASSDDDPAREAEIIRGMLERRVRALLVVPTSADHTYLQVETQLGMPVVFIDRPSSSLAADQVVRDNRGGAYEATRHLLQAGHRRIAAIADHPDVYTARERVRGFTDAMAELGDPAAEAVLRTGVHSARAAVDVVAALVRDPAPPTAFLALNNRISAGTLEALAQAPGPPAFVGFDDFDLASVLGATVVLNDPRELGYEAARLALDRLDGYTGPARTVVLPSRLLTRGSGERGPTPAPGAV